MSFGWRALTGMFLAAFAVALQGQSGPVVQMDYSNPGLTPPHWTLTLYPDGRGHFRSERVHAPAEALDLSKLEVLEQDREIRLSAQFAARVFQAARRHQWFGEECESHLKVAFQGQKRLSYTGPEGQGACVFNYSSDKEIQALGDSLVSVAATILEGVRLEKLLLHDRLGLDSEMEFVTEAAHDGQLQQIGAIRGILERLAEDPNVMERVRKRARVLLARPEE
jgi:hypothetical protein